MTPHYTVAQAVNDWLVNYERIGRDTNTVRTVRGLVENHVIPALGARPLRKLSADDVDEWLAGKAQAMVTSTLRLLHSILRRAITRAQTRDKVKRNVVLLCECPVGHRTGRPSKALTLAQAEAVLRAAEDSPMRGYIVTGLLTGARTEELRPLMWSHVDLIGQGGNPPVPPNIKVWRSVRAGGETKTRKSRRSLALPQRAVTALRAQRKAVDALRESAGSSWQTTISCFRRGWVRSRTTPTSGVTSARSWSVLVWSPRSGRRASCGTASCHSCLTTGCRSSRSRALSDTAARP